MATEDKLIPINIEDEMKSAYIDYSMSSLEETCHWVCAESI